MDSCPHCGEDLVAVFENFSHHTVFDVEGESVVIGEGWLAVEEPVGDPEFIFCEGCKKKWASVTMLLKDIGEN